MFGKTKETIDIDERTVADIAIDDFFGDEAAVAEAVRVDQLRQRVTSVEHQISSQFTSMAAYAQIAQEQIELVRSEAQHANERTERRLVGLIETERNHRMTASGSTPDVIARLDDLESQIAEIRENLTACLSNQKALADAITDLFQPAGNARTPAMREHTSDVDVADGIDVTDLADEPDDTGVSIEHVDDDITADAAAPDGFAAFGAPDITTIVPPSSLPAPDLSDAPAPAPVLTPLTLDGPIAELSLD